MNEMPEISSAEAFDTSKYAATFWQKIKRSLQLGWRYYLWDVPRYWWQRRGAGLPLADWGVLRNPLRSFRVRIYTQFPLPPQHEAALAALAQAGVRIALPRERLDGLIGVWWHTRAVQGDVIECGAFEGATSLLMALLGKMNGLSQRIHMLDTFEGIPPPSAFDLNRSTGEYAPESGQDARILKRAMALGVAERVVIHKGLFADTFPLLAKAQPRYAFAHIDANIYTGTFEACEYVLPRMAGGGALVFDDYNGLCDLGARLAIDRCLAGREKPRPLAECSAYLMLDV